MMTLKGILSIVLLSSILFLACSSNTVDSLNNNTGDDPYLVDYEEFEYAVDIPQHYLEKLRVDSETGYREGVCIEPPFPNDNHWPPTNLVPGFIVVPLEGITGNHIYYIHESVVPDTGVTFSIVEQVYYLSDGTIIGGVEFMPNGTIFLDETYFYWDHTLLFDEAPDELDLLYWFEDEDTSWVVEVNSELTNRERIRAQFAINHFSIYAVRRSTMPKPPPPNGFVMD